MKKSLLSACLGLALAGIAVPSAEAVLPHDYQEFKARYQQEGRTPEGALKLYFEAVFVYINENTRAEGAKMLRYAMHSSTPVEQGGAYATFVSRMKDPRENHVFRSFAVGTSPANSYHMSPDDFQLMITGQTQDAGYLRLFLQSSGADSPRAVWMEQFDGLWYTTNNAATYSQVRPPQTTVDMQRHAHDADYDTPTQPGQSHE